MPNSCKTCLYTENHPLGISFSDEECSGCFTHREKAAEHGQFEGSELQQLLNTYKKARAYDCVVPVVGDAEDYFTLSTVLKAGMSPLVVSVNDYFRNDIGWHNLHNLITYFDVDSFLFNPDMRAYKELVRTSLRKYNHVLLPFIQLHTSFPVHVALQRQIPLVVWGQNQAIEQVGKFSHLDKVEMTRWYRKENDLFNTDIDALMGSGAQVQEHSINYYRYPEPQALGRNTVTGIYLSNYIAWDPLKQNAQAVNQGFVPQNQQGSFDPYERAGSSVYYNIHDLLKQKRVGFRKVTDQLTREARHKRISRSDAQVLESHYSKTKISIKPFFDWLNVTASGYQWFLKHRLAEVAHLVGTPDTTVDITNEIPSQIHSLLHPGASATNDYIVFGKGINI